MIKGLIQVSPYSDALRAENYAVQAPGGFVLALGLTQPLVRWVLMLLPAGKLAEARR
jgi:hypothetical protein